MVWLFIALFLIIIILDLPRLLRKRSYKEIVIFGVFLFMGFYLGMVQLYQWPFYNPIPELAITFSSK